MGGLGGKVAIIGTGTIKFGENFHNSLSDLIFEAVRHAAVWQGGLPRRAGPTPSATRS
jgi:hypothetical protein